MNLDSILVALLLVLTATAICVTFFERVGLGSVVGFIVAGVVIGPNTPGFVATDQVESLQELSELGVVLFLFAVGLEMRPRMLWSMRRQIFGLGFLQVLLSAAPLAALLLYRFELHWQTAVIIGLGLAMSSTAVVMTILTGRNQMSTPYGRSSFAVLTAQDISIVPVMALIPLLAHSTPTGSTVPGWLHAGLAFAVILLIFLAGRYLLPAILGWAARNRKDETFGVTLFVCVLGAAWGMDQVGISMTLGAFLLGILLSASDYRYQIVATVEPFKGVLMGLFFIAVGMSIDVNTLAADWIAVLGILAAVLVTKTAVLLALCRAFRIDLPTSIRTAFSLSQVGEFGFVLFTASAAVGLATAHGVTLGFLVIAGSMILTPLMVGLGDRLADRFDKAPRIPPAATAEDMSRHLVIVGFDSVGRLIAMMADAAAIPYIAFDRDYRTVLRGKKLGGNIHYGDIHARSVQEAAGLARAQAVFLSTGDMDRLKGTALTLHQNYPGLDIYARVETIEDQVELQNKGIKNAGTAFIESTLFRGSSLLRDMGVAEDDVTALLNDLRGDEYARVQSYLTGGENAGNG